MTVSKMATFAIGVLIFTGCTHPRPKSDGTVNAGVESNKILENTPMPQLRETEDPSQVVEERMPSPYKSPLGEVAMDYNPSVEKWLRYFQGRGRGHMERYLIRSTRYLPMMKNVLRENGLPEDLVYVALIESGFTSAAHSHANAVGYWQFIKPTGRRYGLNVDPFIDERRDPVLSTRAAAEYFKSLYSLFGSWHLSLAAYNVGENRVKRSVMKFSTRDFWELAKHRRSFPAETKNYVPKFIAAAMIAKDPEKYGFTNLDYSDPLSYDIITLQNPISFNKLATNLNVDAAELRLLNPKFRGDFVPLSRNGETVVRIPVGMAADATAAASLSVTSQPHIVQTDSFYYRVRRGDSLSTIAKKHRTTVSQLRRKNNLSNRALLRVGMKLLVNDNGGGAKYELASSAPEVKRSVMNVPSEEIEFHKVRRGDNLSTIARKYGVGVSDLLKWNGLSNKSTIRAGQKIRVKAPEASKSASMERLKNQQRKALAVFKSSKGSKNISLASNKRSKAQHLAADSGRNVKQEREKQHTVRPGETLFHVSRRYGIPLQRLAQANGVGLNYRVLAGESLNIP